MSFRKPRALPAARWGVLVLGLTLASRDCLAEFTVGNVLPNLTLQTTEAGRMNLAVVDGAFILTQNSTAWKPSAIVIHLLQPDCLQCRAQLKELQRVAQRFQARGVAVLGISHRGDLKELQQLGKELLISFPLLHGTSSDAAKQYAAGDTLGIADKRGIVQYAQVGFAKGDETLWDAALEELLAGKAVTKTTVDRERLAVGDSFPAVELASIQTGKPLALVGKQGRLMFRDEQGKETQPKGAVGFFSRY